MASNEKIKISSLWECVINNRKCLRHSPTIEYTKSKEKESKRI